MAVEVTELLAPSPDTGTFNSPWSSAGFVLDVLLSAAIELGCHADTPGPVVFPKIFFNETLPLTCGFDLEAVKLGNSGKSVLESLGPFVFLVDSRTLPDVGVGRDPTEDAAELTDHGVIRCG